MPILPLLALGARVDEQDSREEPRIRKVGEQVRTADEQVDGRSVRCCRCRCRCEIVWSQEAADEQVDSDR